VISLDGYKYCCVDALTRGEDDVSIINQ